MSRKREAKRQERIKRAKQAEQQGYLSDLLNDNRWAQVDGKKPALAKLHNGGLSIRGGFGGQGKGIAFISEINVYTLQDAVSAAHEGGYYIWNAELIKLLKILWVIGNDNTMKA